MGRNILARGMTFAKSVLTTLAADRAHALMRRVRRSRRRSSSMPLPAGADVTTSCDQRQNAHDRAIEERPAVPTVGSRQPGVVDSLLNPKPVTMPARNVRRHREPTDSDRCRAPPRSLRVEAACSAARSQFFRQRRRTADVIYEAGWPGRSQNMGRHSCSVSDCTIGGPLYYTLSATA